MSDIPTHIGFVLDGNRRWAKQQGLSSLEGHRKGLDNFNTIARHAFESGVKYVSAFVFSTENWKRTEKEVGYLMGLVTKALEDYLDEFHKEGIKIEVLGRRDGLRKSVLNAITRAEAETKNNTKGTLALCFNYGGQAEIVDAVKKIVDSGVSTDDIDEKTLENSLYAPEVPPLDLVIRTSGENRTSGFMLLRSAYAELYFCDKYWPAFTVEDFDESINWYNQRERRFGK